MSHSTGLAHTVSDCIGYLSAAGLTDVSANEFNPETLVRVTGYKPG
ncbi:MAG: hypothetical protein P8Y69_17970 [Gammaproteobacteria bacterium]